MVAAIHRLEALTCDSVHEAAWLERNLLEERLPRWNRTAGGAEAPVFLRLDPGPARPGLRTSYTEGFGPYLGGARARLALSALLRIHPLQYARTAPTGAEKDMAARRGVGPADRERLTAAIVAVLSRDPAAVREANAHLESLRDRAAAELNFEHAGRIQDEIQALAWITSPQCVHTTGGGDHVVTAWSHGVQVSFDIRAGRLCTWSQRRTARPPATAPPGPWATLSPSATPSWPLPFTLRPVRRPWLTLHLYLWLSRSLRTPEVRPPPRPPRRIVIERSPHTALHPVCRSAPRPARTRSPEGDPAVPMSTADRFRYTLVAGATAVVIGLGFTFVGLRPPRRRRGRAHHPFGAGPAGRRPGAAGSGRPTAPCSTRRHPSTSASPSASATRKPSAKPKPKPTTKAPKPKPPKAPQTSGSILDRALAHINAARTAEGLSALKLDANLSKAAALHNQLMINGCGLSHQCSGEGGIGDRFSAQSVTLAFGRREHRLRFRRLQRLGHPGRRERPHRQHARRDPAQRRPPQEPAQQELQAHRPEHRPRRQGPGLADPGLRRLTVRAGPAIRGRDARSAGPARATSAARP